MGIPSKLVNDTVFVGGFGFSPDDFPNSSYWGSLGSSIFWIPKDGPLSSNQDRACEILAATMKLKEVTYVDGCHKKKKPTYTTGSWLYQLSILLVKIFNMCPNDTFGPPNIVSETSKIKFITHSAGYGAVAQLLVYLHQHKVGLIKRKIEDGKKLAPAEERILSSVKDSSDYKYRVLFFDNDGNPLDVSPFVIDKIAFISPTAGGADYVRSSSGMYNDDLSFATYSLGRLLCWLAITLDRLLKYVPFPLLNLYLDQFAKIYQYTDGTDTIFQGLVEPVAQHLTIQANYVMSLYDIQSIRVTTKACVKIGWIYFPLPNLSPLLWQNIIGGCGWRNDAKFGDEYTQCLQEHDGCISTKSQRYGLECDCLITKTLAPGVNVCMTCGCIHTNLDHLAILRKGATSLVAQTATLEWLST